MNALYMLITAIFDIYLMVVLLRLWLGWVRADFYNPFSQLIVKATNPPLVPLRRIIPGWGGFDIAALVLAFAIAAAKIALLMGLGGQFDALTMLYLGFLTLLDNSFDVVVYTMIIMAVMSFVVQGYHPVSAVLHQMTEPLLAPIRRIIPPLGGFDLSVLVFILGLQVIKVLIISDLLGGAGMRM